MATYRVPQQHQQNEAGGIEPAAETRRGSIDSTNGADVAAASAPAAEMEMQHTGDHSGAAAASAAGTAAAAPNVNNNNKGTDLPRNRKMTYLERHPDEAHEGWSRGRKICCCITLIFLALLIIVGILVAFMVRIPSVSYDRSDIICPNNDYEACIRDQIQVKVYLKVDNPNILGATINADLALYKQDGTYLGPGYVEDTSIGKRGVTEVTALFNITSSRGYDILQKLFLPPQSSVTVDVKGTVYIHVGLIKPSAQFEDSFTIPPQSAVSLIQGIDLPSLDLPPIAVPDIPVPDVPDVPSIPDIPSIPDVPALPFVKPAATNGWSGVIQKKGEVVTAAKFARALVAVGPPHSAIAATAATPTVATSDWSGVAQHPAVEQSYGRKQRTEKEQQ